MMGAQKVANSTVVEWIATRKGGVRATEIAEHFGMSPKSASTHLRRGEASGALRRVKRGVYATPRAKVAKPAKPAKARGSVQRVVLVPEDGTMSILRDLTGGRYLLARGDELFVATRLDL